jgi:hypothetical protein
MLNAQDERADLDKQPLSLLIAQLIRRRTSIFLHGAVKW